jgi:3',5'-cyclic AMP phosphodiesterase CpdA
MNRTNRRHFLGQGALYLAGTACFSAAETAKPDAKAKEKEKAKADADAGKPRKDPYADAKLVDGPPPMPQKGAFTIVALPDTQHYEKKFESGFSAQTRWIVEQREARNISCVLHLGDITNNNRPEQWENAVKSMRLLDGKVPYFMSPGNHDYSDDGKAADRSTLFSKYFPASELKKAPNFGGFYDKEPERVENSYHLFSAGGRKFLVLCLEFGPRRDVVRWANEIAGQHHDREAILVTHAYVYHDSTRYDFKKFGKKQTWNPHAYEMAKATNDDMSDGEELWRNLVSKHPNFIFTINGHVLGDGLGRVNTKTPHGRAVEQMLVNFQMKPKGGDGWLRLLEMRTDGSVQVCDYSPTRNQRNESEQNQFLTAVAPVGRA